MPHPLMQSASCGDRDECARLLAANQSIEGYVDTRSIRPYFRESTALIEAVKEGHEEVVELLLDHGASIHQKDGE